MKVPGSVYTGREGRKYLALYNYWPDIYRAAPPSFSNSKHIAHVSYGTGRVERGIDIFLINQDLSKINFKEVDIKRTIPFEKNSNLTNVDREYNIQYKIIQDIAQKQNEILYLIRRDVKDFCKREAKNHSKTKRITYVDKITPKSMEEMIRPIKQEYLLQSGKQEFTPSCSYEANADFSWGCPSGFVNGFLDPFAECGYCYSAYQHKSFPKHILDFSKKQILEELSGRCHLGFPREKELGRPVKVLRLGKRTEAGSKYTLDLLVKTLEACVETGTQVVMPTKYLEFDKEIAKLLKKTHSTVLYSIGRDDMEKGACSHGCNNQFRLNQARIYRRVGGVNSAIYMMIDLPRPPTQNNLEVLKFAKVYDLPVQLLPIRITSKEMAKKLTGMSWDSLKSNNNEANLFSGKIESGGYAYAGAGMLVAQEKHSFWLNIIKKNNNKLVRMCHHDEKETYCGKCFLDNKKGIITETKHPEIVYQRERRGRWRDIRIEREKQKRARINTTIQGNLLEQENSLITNENGQ